MNYPEELRERYNEVMFDERDIIEKFLKDQYDLRYGHQRDTWHFEPAIELVAQQGSRVLLHDIKLDKDKFVIFCVDAFCDKNVEWECFDFAYGELSKVIEALPNVEDVVWNNAINDLKVMAMNYRNDILLSENPFVYEIGSKHYTLDDIKITESGTLCLVQALGNDTPVSDLPLETLVSLRDHINISVLHGYNEYKKLVKFLSEQPYLYFEPANFGDVQFTIHGTDVKVDILSASLDANDKLQLCIGDDGQEPIYLKEKDIRPEYLVDLVGYIEDHCYRDIMDTYNSHNVELVRKINTAWKDRRYHDSFGDILYALTCRDMDEWEEKYNDIIHDSEDAMRHAHEIMEDVCDDQDLETILSFIRYK